MPIRGALWYHITGDMMQRYFISEAQCQDGVAVIQGQDHHHIRNVMRGRIHDPLALVYAGSLWLGEIEAIDHQMTRVRLKEELPSRMIPYRVTLAQALIRRERFEWVLEKATELGVAEIVPIQFTRSVVKSDGYSIQKMTRYHTILKEAAEQSERLDIPRMCPPMRLTELELDGFDRIVLCYERQEETSRNLSEILLSASASERLMIIIGPEGGITLEEQSYLTHKKAVLATLGPGILRSETAAIAAMSLVHAIWGDAS